MSTKRRVRVASRRRSRAGFNLVEVMMAVAILAVGATGILGLQTAAIRGNQEANEFATATRTVELWIDRYRLDALAWRQGGPGVLPGPAILANTELLQAVTVTPGWQVPTTTSLTFPAASQLSFNGNPNPAPGAPVPVFCTQSRLRWVYDGTAIRVDVRTFWRRRGPTSTDGALVCPDAPDRLNYHVVQGSTLVRWTPEDPRRI
jgi:type IV pilus assembly protein PilV